MSDQEPDVVRQAREYYDSSDADNFYFNIWGGEDLHIGWYQSEDESIFDASQRTVRRMLSKIDHLPAGSKVLDLGAGFGGSARLIVRETGHHVTCLNLSVVQNDRNRRMNEEQGLADKVDVYDGNFEELPFGDDAFDAIWSQDSFLHSGKRKQIFEEMDRVLRSGGDVIFTDPMQREDVDPATLQPVLDRIHLESLGSIEKYTRYAEELGWKVVEIEEKTDTLAMHYARVLEELESRTEEMKQHCSTEYIEKMKQGLRHWVEAGRNGALAWGILHFRKS